VPLPRASDGATSPATLRITDADGRRCLELTGDLDLAGVEAVRAALLAELSGTRPATVDLSRLGFVTSVGAGLLLDAAQTAAPGLDVVPPAGGPARRLLDITGLSSVLRRRDRLLPG